MAEYRLESEGSPALLSELDAAGCAVLCVGATLTVYFRDGFRSSVREAVLRLVNEYVESAGSRLLWWFTEGRRYSSTARLKTRDMSAYFLSPKYEAPDSDLKWSFAWHGGDRPEAASSVRIEGLGASRLEVESHGALSYLRASFPIEIDWRVLLEHAVHWGNALRPVHGYGGPCLIPPAHEDVAARHEGLILARASRFPGLEVDSPADHALWTKHAVKGGNWLTLLGDEMLDRLGGVGSIASFLGSEFTLHSYPGGCVVQAGNLPEIGDRNRRESTPRLAKLARLLKPIRVATHPGIRTSAAGFGRDAFEQWLGRFDDSNAP